MISQSILSIERSISTQVDSVFYTNDNPSGFITGISNIVYTTGDQTISGRKQFSDGLDAGSQTGISTLYVGSGLVGVNNENPQAAFDVSGSVLFSQRPTVNTTGVMLSGDIDVSNFYQNNNPSGFITGIENLVYTTGDQNISGIKTFANNVTILGNFAVSGTTFINEVVDVTTTGIISGVTGVFQHIEAENVVYNQTDSYIVAQQGDDLAVKYAAAKALTPNGLAKSATNRVSLIIFPGTYTLSAELEIDAEFVDIIGLGAQTQKPAVLIAGYTLNTSANDVRVSGISVGAQSFKITGDKPLQVFENCTGGDYSFGVDGTANGIFTNCTGGGYSFGGNGTASGVFVNCTGGGYSFAGYAGTASGVFTDCTGGLGSFAGNGGTASGIFTNCTGGNYSFAGNGGIASGTFMDCTSAFNCFGGNYGVASGTFRRCMSSGASFGGTEGVASGIFTDCTSSSNSFGGSFGTASGTFTNCRLTLGTFLTLTAPATGKAIMVNCLDGNGDIIEGQAPI